MLDYRNDSEEADETVTVSTTENPDTTTDAGGAPAGKVVYQASDGQALGTAVAFAVAEFRGVDPVELANDTVIGATVDLELIDDLAAGSEEWTFEFTLSPERVLVESDGAVTVTHD